MWHWDLSEHTVLYWTPFNGRLYAVCLDRPAVVSGSRLKRRCLLIVSLYVFTDCSSLEAQEFYRNLFGSLRSVRSTDIMAVAGDIYAQLSYIAETERHIRGPSFVLAEHFDNKDSLI